MIQVFGFDILGIDRNEDGEKPDGEKKEYNEEGEEEFLTERKPAMRCVSFCIHLVTYLYIF